MASSQSISIEPILLPSLSLKALPLSSAASPHIFPDRCYTHPFHSYFHFFAQHVPALQRVPCIYMTPTRHSRSVQASHILKSSLMTPGLSSLVSFILDSIIRGPQIRCERVQSQLDLQLNFLHIISNVREILRLGYLSKMFDGD